MLSDQFSIELLLKGLQGVVVAIAPGYGYSPSFGFGGSKFDQVLNFIIVYTIYAEVGQPSRANRKGTCSQVAHSGMERCWSVSPYFMSPTDPGSRPGMRNGVWMPRGMWYRGGLFVRLQEKVGLKPFVTDWSMEMLVVPFRDIATKKIRCGTIVETWERHHKGGERQMPEQRAGKGE